MSGDRPVLGGEPIPDGALWLDCGTVGNWHDGILVEAHDDSLSISAAARPADCKTWHVVPDAGICIPVEHIPALVEWLQRHGGRP